MFVMINYLRDHRGYGYALIGAVIVLFWLLFGTGHEPTVFYSE